MTKTTLLDYLDNRPETIIPASGDGNTFKALSAQSFPAMLLDATLTSRNLIAEDSQGMLTLSEYAKFLRDMRLKKTGVLIADLQSGFGNPLNTYYAAKELERSGGDILLLNDQTYPAHTTAKPLTTTPEDLIGKLRAAKDSFENPDTRIWIKLEGIHSYGIEGIIERIQYLAKAGADAIAIDHYDGQQLRELTQMKLPLPLLATWQPGTEQIDGITGWLDKGYLSTVIQKAQNQAINFIKQGGLAYAEK
ncbi:isocitrate lyase/phosphoenolpyruvate mutase family protein [Lentilactobacillus hilgardii]|jgi:2-methylisocitrate lyase-like PEP mutase family enzyme|uniref:Carboxyvinyl-carboxyphosphonate phosphorylmutase n=1 Tax=Lentilactobacillus hilgardii TaxID=1588 RepID=A0A6P1EG78_LENHI|nr:isocitrate lyase/phosphoenolpyruvate mutase family protein [Lentilactobacillus hilgardii]MCT3391312.1 carboxyvinyl-carboxyphosphonate phosphorylmutase [Lentilactobacillus hilgardii]QHB52994.1 carboxyvinyl-carboxyphosphonate phosphorylmutase [Lentilactobacillus hilgardii]RRG12453.1 MAG: carboxyvinyl-carboxyphosphonate phosphorylmutase [Lactobacillus sp.]